MTVLAAQEKRRDHRNQQRDGEYRIDNRNRVEADRIFAEWLEQLRSIDREGIEPDRCLQRYQHEDQPLFELCSISIESMHQPGQKRRGDEVDQDRMRIPAMPGELGDFVEKRVSENVEVGKRSEQTAPENGPIAELPAEENLADRATDSDLGYGVHSSTHIAKPAFPR